MPLRAVVKDRIKITFGWALLAIALLLLPPRSWAQAGVAPGAATQARITAAIDESRLTTLRGNTHPLARREFDQGAAPASLPMRRMLLVLQRSPAQEAALAALLEQQQDKSSPNYRHWLTPAQVGQQFGPAEQDIQTVTLWLQSHGFQVAKVAQSRMVIEFSGTASQILQAFHTQIHKYTVSGKDHWANASDPQIPVALAPVVAGIDTLHNFGRKPMHQLAGVFGRSKTSGAVQRVQPLFTFPGGCGSSASSPCYAVGPYDFATIYNVLPLWTAGPAIDGTGETIAIVGESNINIQDVKDFRSMFGLAAKDPVIILDGPDPGLVSGVETEADLDVEWSGAVAPNATIDLVVAQSTETSQGVDLAAEHVVDNNLAPILSESFGYCEAGLGAAGNQFYSQLWQQAAAQGITVLVSTGDSGSAGCDYSSFFPSPAQYGLQISGIASTPYNVAVGGTDFNDLNNPLTYWNSTNDGTLASAKGYVPEMTWNDSCTNSETFFLTGAASAEPNCNSPSLNAFFVNTIGGSGGKSSCINGNGSTLSSCTQGYAKPTWQTGTGVPADSRRDIPDVSLFAADGLNGNFYIICESDATGGSPCPSQFLGVGGTSASTPSFAGIMALVNQSTGARQGNANYILYKLAASTPSAFHDVTTGTIAMPCAKGSLNCTVNNSSDQYGVLTGYATTAGYDLATGLGTINAANLVNAWASAAPNKPTATTLTLNNGTAVSITHGASVPVSITVASNPPAGTPTGNVSLIAAATPSGVQSYLLSSGSVSSNTSLLPGGTYNVTAHYPGDGSFAASDSAPSSVTVNPEASKTLITIPVFDPATGLETGNTPTSIVYGSPYIGRIDVGNAQAKTTFPPTPVCTPPACPTGPITWTDALNGGVAASLDGGTFALNSEGFADDMIIQLVGGSHVLAANYGGDSSYNASSSAYTLTVTPAPTQMSVPYIPYSPELVGTPVSISSFLITNLNAGAAPTGTITFYDGGTPIPGTVTYTARAGSTVLDASVTGAITATFTTSGTHAITAKYNGDANYAAATSTAWNATVLYPTTMTQTESSTNINYGDSITVTAKATSSGKSPAMTGQFQFYGSYTSIPSPVTPTLSTDASGNQVLTATVTTTPQSSEVIQVTYSGDSNYDRAYSSQFINVNIPDFSVGSSASTMSMAAGQSGMATITVTPQSNVASTVNLACDVTRIAGATCSFNPPSPMNLTNGAAVSTTMTLTTLPPSSSPTTSWVVRMHGPVVLPGGQGNWWVLSILAGLAALLLSLLLIGKRQRLASALGLICVLILMMSCGGGSGNGGGSGGGGGGGPVPTSVTLTTSSVKVPAGTNPTFTATVTSTKTPTGLVTFFDGGNPIDSAPVTNGTAAVQPPNLFVGTHVITAQYAGDANNQPSKTNGAINQVITGTNFAIVTGATSSLNRSVNIDVTIQ